MFVYKTIFIFFFQFSCSIEDIQQVSDNIENQDMTVIYSETEFIPYSPIVLAMAELRNVCRLYAQLKDPENCFMVSDVKSNISNTQNQFNWNMEFSELKSCLGSRVFDEK